MQNFKYLSFPKLPKLLKAVHNLGIHQNNTVPKFQIVSRAVQNSGTFFFKFSK